MRRIVGRLILALLALSVCHLRTDAHAKERAADNATGGTGPKIIMIIRHAEKPEDSKEEKDPNLSPRGFERAKALAKVIPDDFPHPDFLIATRRSSHSNRPMETIEPLAKKLHEPIEATFKDDDVAALAHKILNDPKFSGKIVLIAWHHGKIPELAHDLGAADAPAKWNAKVFDRVWEISFSDGMAKWKDLPQKALPGDSQE